jgi:hypothetical protein
MKALLSLCLTAATVTTFAQAPVDTKNPVTWSATQVYQREAKFIVASAEEMPADKYNYHPTAGQWDFGKIVSHVAAANSHVCAMLNDQHAPAATHVSPTASKPELIAALKASFDFCDTAFSSLDDAKLGDTITFFGGARVPRARALIEEVTDLNDHYSQMAGYLRLNGLLPPSAEPKK